MLNNFKIVTMEKFKLIGIKWDCDGVNPKKYNLPTNAIVEAEDEDDAVDVATEQYGFCIESIEDITPTPKMNVSAS
jgi:hypothetical protein